MLRLIRSRISTPFSVRVQRHFDIVENKARAELAAVKARPVEDFAVRLAETKAALDAASAHYEKVWTRYQAADETLAVPAPAQRFFDRLMRRQEPGPDLDRARRERDDLAMELSAAKHGLIAAMAMESRVKKAATIARVRHAEELESLTKGLMGILASAALSRRVVKGIPALAFDGAGLIERVAAAIQRRRDQPSPKPTPSPRL